MFIIRLVDECDIIYVDFAKAFDEVPHHRLFGKLAAMGVKVTIVTGEFSSGSRGECNE